MPPISLKSSDRVFITGKTGSGKTYLASYITRGIRRLVVLDGKGSLGSWNCEPWDNNSINKLTRGEEVRIRALAPLSIDPLHYWDEVLMTCFKAGNCTVYIDELYAIVPPNKEPSAAMFAVYTRGREFGLGVWASTQRPVWVPLVAMSESEHYFMFRLSLFEDRRRLAAFMSEEVLKTIRDEHGFYYQQANWTEPVYVKQLEVIHGKTSKTVTTKNAVPRALPDMRRSAKRTLFRPTNHGVRMSKSILPSDRAKPVRTRVESG